VIPEQVGDFEDYRGGITVDYSISQAAQKTAVPARRLLAWQEAGYLDPRLRKKGLRFVRAYTEEDITVLNRVRELLQQGYQLKAAFHQSRQEHGPAGSAPVA